MWATPGEEDPSHLPRATRGSPSSPRCAGGRTFEAVSSVWSYPLPGRALGILQITPLPELVADAVDSLKSRACGRR